MDEEFALTFPVFLPCRPVEGQEWSVPHTIEVKAVAEKDWLTLLPIFSDYDLIERFIAESDIAGPIIALTLSNANDLLEALQRLDHSKVQYVVIDHRMDSKRLNRHWPVLELLDQLKAVTE